MAPAREPAEFIELLVMVGGAIILGEAAWFALLWPLGPVTARAALIEAAVPLPIFAYGYAVYRLNAWLSESRLNAMARRVLATAAVLSVGIAAFLALFMAVTMFRKEFGWRIF